MRWPVNSNVGHTQLISFVCLEITDAIDVKIHGPSWMKISFTML